MSVELQEWPTARSLIGEHGRMKMDRVRATHHHSLRGLLPGIPCRQRPQPARDEARLRHAKEEATGDEGAIAILEGLERADGAEEEQLERQPFPGPDAVEDHVGGDLEEDDTQREHLLTDVELCGEMLAD